MSDLVTWLRAQLDEDERVAREASGDTWVTGASMGYKYSRPGDVYAIARNGTPARIAQGTRCGPDISAEQSSEHIIRHNPARVLVEVEAKRRILDWYDAAWAVVKNHPDDMGNKGWGLSMIKVIKLLALPYATREGYREEWRPA